MQHTCVCNIYFTYIHLHIHIQIILNTIYLHKTHFNKNIHIMLTECDHNNGDQLSTFVTVMDGFSFSQRQQPTVSDNVTRTSEYSQQQWQ